MNQGKLVILFVCTNNAGRSQITEALFRNQYGDRYQVLSAGVDPWEAIHPVGREVMRECGFSMDGHVPKHVKTIDFDDVDVIVTIGDPAEEGTRDLRRGVTHFHWDLGDPARADGTADSKSVFIETKRRIEERIPALATKLALPHNLSAFSFKPAICTCLFNDARPEEGLIPAEDIPRLAENGFKAIELTCYRPRNAADWDDDGDVDELLRVCADNDMAIWSVHPPENEILLGNDDQARGENLAMIRRFADFADRLGAACLPVHFWSQINALAEMKAEVLNKTLRELDEISLTRDAVICLETIRKPPSLVGNEEILDILKTRVSNLGLLVDTGHSHISGDLHETITTAGRALKSLHVHDNDGVNDQHLVPGKGTIDWPRFAVDLKKSGYAGPIVYEVGYIDENDIPAALRDLANHHQSLFED